MQTVSVRLPLPASELGPNYNPATVKDRIALSDMRRAFKYDCKDQFVRAIMNTGVYKHIKFPITVNIDYYFNSITAKRDYALYPKGAYSPRDQMNARYACKSLQDSMILAKVIPDDSQQFVNDGYCKIHKGKDNPENRSCIVVTLEWDGE